MATSMGISACELMKCPYWVDGKCTYLGMGCFYQDDDMYEELTLLNKLRELAQRKLEIWEEDTKGLGLTWREDPLALEYQELAERIEEIKRELFGDAATEV